LLYALIHSPIVGPSTWRPVAEELEARGYRAIVPVLSDSPYSKRPYWEQHALSAAAVLEKLPEDEHVVLVAHSGAGLLLPSIREAAHRPASAYVFVDAGIAVDGKSRLDLLREEMPEAAEEAVSALRTGARVPNWTDEALSGVIPDPDRRRAVLQELNPQPLAYYEEPIPVPPWWPDAPCFYIQLSPVYDIYAKKAQGLGWTYRKLDGGHFHMLLHPAPVAETILELTAQLAP
jgi:pimeloyl-ACP methyl ester carboxylesterase